MLIKLRVNNLFFWIFINVLVFLLSHWSFWCSDFIHRLWLPLNFLCTEMVSYFLQSILPHFKPKLSRQSHITFTFTGKPHINFFLNLRFPGIKTVSTMHRLQLLSKKLLACLVNCILQLFKPMLIRHIHSLHICYETVKKLVWLQIFKI